MRKLLVRLSASASLESTFESTFLRQSGIRVARLYELLNEGKLFFQLLKL